MKFFPTKAQWRKYSKTDRATHIGAWVGAVSLVSGIVFFLWPQSGPPASGSLIYTTPDTNLSAKVADAVVEKLLVQMDTNRVRVEVLIKEVEQLQNEKKSNQLEIAKRDVELAQKKAELADAVTNIDHLQKKLAATVPFTQLAANDQARVTNAVAQAAKGSTFHAKTARFNTIHFGP